MDLYQTTVGWVYAGDKETFYAMDLGQVEIKERNITEEKEG